MTPTTAAVIPVSAADRVYFALHTLFAETGRITTGPMDFEVPALRSLQVPALAVTALGCRLVFARGWSVLRTLGACAAAGVALHLLTATTM